jgi:hypothetical protein
MLLRLVIAVGAPARRLPTMPCRGPALNVCFPKGRLSAVGRYATDNCQS